MNTGSRWIRLLAARSRPRATGAVATGAVATAACVLGACAMMLSGCSTSETDGHRGDSTSVRIADVRGRATTGNADYAPGTTAANRVIASLATASPTAQTGFRGVSDTATLRGGIIVGRLEISHAVRGDSVIVPTHDVEVCRAYTETVVPSERGGVGNAIVWLVGVSQGPVPEAPVRAVLTLDRCRLEPRVQRVPLGSSFLVKSRDAMMSQLRFTDMATLNSVRASVNFNDAGQVVPTSAVAAMPGVVEVHDDLHPWIRAYVVVSPHAYVAVTSADGQFRFDAVPPGTYTLVVWQETLGVRTRSLRIATGVETRVVVDFVN